MTDQEKYEEDQEVTTPSAPEQTQEMKDRAVLVALDVKYRIASNIFEPRDGFTYLSIPTKPDLKVWALGQEGPDVDVRDMFMALEGSAYPPEDKKCMVCAIGGMFYSAVMVFDGIKRDKYLMQNRLQPEIHEMMNFLKTCWTPNQLEDIESLFEKMTCANSNNPDDRMTRYQGKDEYQKFFSDYTDGPARLNWICDSIIANGGVFVLPELG